MKWYCTLNISFFAFFFLSKIGTLMIFLRELWILVRSCENRDIYYFCHAIFVFGSIKFLSLSIDCDLIRLLGPEYLTVFLYKRIFDNFQDNAVLAVLLEAGGCATLLKSCAEPDPYYVDQLKATLAQLDLADVFNECNTRFMCENKLYQICFIYLPPKPYPHLHSAVGKPSDPCMHCTDV